MTPGASDQDLVRLVASGDSAALAELYDRHSSILYSVALRVLANATDAEDALQQAWLQAWRSASAYDARRGTVVAWLLTLARSRALDLRRSRTSRRRAEDATENEPRPSPPDPSASHEHRRLHERVTQALAALQPQQRQVLEIAYFEGMSQSEIAARLGAPLGTVKSWTRQGLMRLRELLPNEERM